MQRRIETKSKIARFLTSLACILFGMCIILNMDNIKTAMVDEVIPYVHSHMSKPSPEVTKINSKFTTILHENEDVVDVVLFKFIKEEDDTTMYKGQVGVTVLNRGGKNVIDNSIYILSDNNKAFQEILLNKVHYENVTSVRAECNEFFNARDKFSCSASHNVNIAYKTVVTIPISDKDGYSVIGYILLTIDREYDNTQIQKVVSSIKPHIVAVQETMNKL